MLLFGVHPDAAKAWLGGLPDEPEEFVVWADNWPTMTLFLTLQTQWRIVQSMAGGAWTGLDYAAAGATMEILGIPRAERAPLFADLCLMERAALPILNKPKEK